MWFLQKKVLQNTFESKKYFWYSLFNTLFKKKSLHICIKWPLGCNVRQYEQLCWHRYDPDWTVAQWTLHSHLSTRFRRRFWACKFPEGIVLASNFWKFNWFFAATDHYYLSRWNWADQWNIPQHSECGQKRNRHDALWSETSASGARI